MCDESPRLVARDSRPAKNAPLCERQQNQVNIASHDVPESLPRTEVLDPGCEVHIADETDPPGYEIKPTEDSRSGRGFLLVDGKITPNKGGAVRQSQVVVGNGQMHPVSCTFQAAKVAKPIRSVSMICDAGFDVLFTKAEARVRDPQGGHVICTYPRAGALYKGDMRIRTPVHQSFRRQGQSGLSQNHL